MAKRPIEGKRESFSRLSIMSTLRGVFLARGISETLQQGVRVVAKEAIGDQGEALESSNLNKESKLGELDP